MQSKKEFMAEQEAIYERKKKAEKLANELQQRIAEIREMGYKLIVLGSTVKITI